MDQKPTLIIEIEKLLGTTLYPAPVRGNDLLGGLMPYKRDMPKYAVDGEKVIGLNLAKTGLTNENGLRYRAYLNLNRGITRAKSE